MATISSRIAACARVRSALNCVSIRISVLMSTRIALAAVDWKGNNNERASFAPSRVECSGQSASLTGSRTPYALPARGLSASFRVAIQNPGRTGGLDNRGVGWRVPLAGQADPTAGGGRDRRASRRQPRASPSVRYLACALFGISGVARNAGTIFYSHSIVAGGFPEIS